MRDLAFDASERGLPIQYAIIGYSSITDKLAAVGVTETGYYKDDSEAWAKLEAARPHFAFFPSISPETHSYTLSIALAVGLPSVVFDIGAPAERLRALETGHILNFSLAMSPSALNDALLALNLERLWEHRPVYKGAEYKCFVEDYYR